MGRGLKQGTVDWCGQVPVSRSYDDPYYSLEDGLAESRFVFLDGNDIQERFGRHTHLTIGETGFGTGLNFLATWQAWRQNGAEGRLTFISAEAHPMSRTDMAAAHAAFPEIETLAHALRAAWPPAAAGQHLRFFDDGKITLILLFGDAAASFRDLQATVDAWYLDGFAPAKNPDMWSEALFEQIARLSAPIATLATFTAAGFVRRGLAAQGFAMRKAPGFGRKRERLLGVFDAGTAPAAPAATAYVPTWAATSPAAEGSIAVIGGGIAGASVAAALSRRGRRVTQVHLAGHADTASKLPAAMLTPRFMLGDQPERRFFNAAFAHAVWHPALAGAFAAERGAQLLATSEAEAERQQRIADTYGWDSDWLQRSTASLTLPQAGTVDAAAVLDALCEGADRLEAAVQSLRRSGDRWQLLGPGDALLLETETVVIAAGVRTTALLEASGLVGGRGEAIHPQIKANAGQLEIVAAHALKDIPATTLAYGGYVTAAIGDSATPTRTVGSSFERLAAVPDGPLPAAPATRERILGQFAEATGGNLAPDTETTSWTGLRATVPDHLPYAGPVPDWLDLATVCAPLAADATAPLSRAPDIMPGLYCLSGLGSKGFQYGPLLGEYLAAMICGEANPLPLSLIAKLHPARSMVRHIVRGA